MKRIFNIIIKIYRKIITIYLLHNINIKTKIHSFNIIDNLNKSIDIFNDQNNEIKDKCNNLRENTLIKYKDLYKKYNLKFMIHVPNTFSMGGKSVFENWIEGLNYLGVECKAIPWNFYNNKFIDQFKPNLIITSDHHLYLNQLDWNYLKNYKKEHNCLFSLSASHEKEGNTLNQQRLEVAKENKVDFYFSFYNQDYISNNYGEWSDYGYDIISIPFSGNPLTYFFEELSVNKYDYTFLGSTNPEKAGRYYKFFSRIFRKYEGLIIGPGWNFNNDKLLDRRLHNKYYHSGNIALNLHIPSQIEHNTELNERTFSIASCATFQLIDNPKALSTFFPETNKVAYANNPKEYHDLFRYFINYPEKRTSYILYALKIIYKKNTIFHRMSNLIEYVININSNSI